MLQVQFKILIYLNLAIIWMADLPLFVPCITKLPAQFNTREFRSF